MAEQLIIPVNSDDTIDDHSVVEDIVKFKRYSDQKVLSIDNKEGEVVAQISGYGLEIGFNYKYFKKEEDIQAAAEAIAELAVKLIMETMVQKANEKIASLEK